jgi:hypothetical protein
VFVRYDTPNEHGETRRERNERFEQPSPELIIPDGGQYLWDWYHELAEGVGRINDGVCRPIPWGEYLAWAKVSGSIVRTDEYAILRAMDASFCDEMNKELQAYQERLRDPTGAGKKSDG